MPAQDRPTRDGFSLIEILIVVAIMATLMGLLLPALQKVRLSARRLESRNNLRQIATATHLWHDTNAMLPRTCGWNNQSNIPVQFGVNGTPFFAILPFMGQEALYLPSLGPLINPGIRFDPTDPVKYQVFVDTIESNCTKCVGVVAYRANVLASSTPPPQTPKQFLSVLDVSTSNLTTATSYLANKDLFDLGYAINQIPDGSSQTMMYAEGVKTCDGGDSVYDNLNAFDPAPFRYRVIRTNNWAVGSEAVVYDYSMSKYVLKSKVKVVDFTKSDYSASTPVSTQYLLDGQFSGVTTYPPYNASNIYITSAYYYTYTNLDRYDQFCAKGNIPAFFKGPLESPSMQLQYVFNNGAWTRNGVPATERNVTFQPVGTYVNQKNCVWFAPQAFSGGLNVVMADASVHTIDPSVSQASWDAAISPKGNDFVGPDFFE